MNYIYFKINIMNVLLIHKIELALLTKNSINNV